MSEVKSETEKLFILLSACAYVAGYLEIISRGGKPLDPDGVKHIHANLTKALTDITDIEE